MKQEVSGRGLGPCNAWDWVYMAWGRGGRKGRKREQQGEVGTGGYLRVGGRAQRMGKCRQGGWRGKEEGGKGMMGSGNRDGSGEAAKGDQGAEVGSSKGAARERRREQQGCPKESSREAKSGI